VSAARPIASLPFTGAPIGVLIAVGLIAVALGVGLTMAGFEAEAHRVRPKERLSVSYANAEL